MPRLCDIVKEGVPCKVISPVGTTCIWDGEFLAHTSKEQYGVSFLVLFCDEWQLAEPTVENLLEERGYRDAGLGTFSCVIGANQNYPSVTVPKITSPDEASRICDFLDTLKGTK